MKTSIIKIPKGFRVKEIKDGKIILEKQKETLTYEKIALKLFQGTFYFVSGSGGVCETITSPLDHTNVTSERQGEKLLAINKLMNVAKYLNGDWQPDWSYMEEVKYAINFNHAKNNLVISQYNFLQSSHVYFRTKELAEKAIEILGEETIKLALCTDY